MIRKVKQLWIAHPKSFALAGFIFFSIWFVPWVFLLWSNSITVDRLSADKTEITERVGPDEKNWIDIEKIPRHVGYAFIAAEDNKFYSHWGLDLISLFDSVKFNLKKGKYARGASTITQQTVKVSLLSHEKSIIRKMREAAGAIALESIMPKKKILEWYINLIEFGPGIYGIKEASYYYFSKHPAYLSIEESIHLAQILPNPRSWSHILRSRQMSQFAEERFAAIATNMRLSGFISTQRWSQAMGRGKFGAAIVHYPKVFRDAVQMLNRQDEERIREEEATEVVEKPSPLEDEDPTDSLSSEESEQNMTPLSAEEKQADLDLSANEVTVKSKPLEQEDESSELAEDLASPEEPSDEKASDEQEPPEDEL